LSFVAQPSGAGDVVVKSRSPVCRTDEERDAITVRDSNKELQQYG